MSALTPEFRCRKMLVEYARSIGTGIDVLRYPSRGRERAWARQNFMLLARRAGFSSPVIGRVLDMDHSTVIQGARRAEARLAEHDETRCPCCDQPLPVRTDAP